MLAKPTNRIKMHTFFMTIYVIGWTLWHSVFPEKEEPIKNPEPRRKMKDEDTAWYTENYLKTLQDKQSIGENRRF